MKNMSTLLTIERKRCGAIAPAITFLYINIYQLSVFCIINGSNSRITLVFQPLSSARSLAVQIKPNIRERYKIYIIQQI